TTHIYTLSLHDALPISLHIATPGSCLWTLSAGSAGKHAPIFFSKISPLTPFVVSWIIWSTNGTTASRRATIAWPPFMLSFNISRSEEHTSELQSLAYLV